MRCVHPYRLDEMTQIEKQKIKREQDIWSFMPKKLNRFGFFTFLLLLCCWRPFSKFDHVYAFNRILIQARIAISFHTIAFHLFIFWNIWFCFPSTEDSFDLYYIWVFFIYLCQCQVWSRSWCRSIFSCRLHKAIDTRSNAARFGLLRSNGKFSKSRTTLEYCSGE